MSLIIVKSNIWYLHYFKAFGFAPFTLNDSDLPTTPENIAYVIVLQFLNIIDFAFTVLLIKTMFNSNGIVSSISLTLQYISGSLTLFVVLCESFLARQSHKDLLRELNKIDAILEEDVKNLKIDVNGLVSKKLIVIGLTGQMILFFVLAGVSMIRDGLVQLFLCQMSVLFFVYTRMIQMMFYLILIIERLVIYKRVIQLKTSKNVLVTEDLWSFKKFFGCLDRANEYFNAAFGCSVLIISIQNFIQAITNIYEIVMIVGGFEQSRSLIGEANPLKTLKKHNEPFIN